MKNGLVNPLSSAYPTTVSKKISGVIPVYPPSSPPSVFASSKATTASNSLAAFIIPGITCLILILQAIMTTGTSRMTLKISREDKRQTLDLEPSFSRTIWGLKSKILDSAVIAGILYPSYIRNFLYYRKVLRFGYLKIAAKTPTPKEEAKAKEANPSNIDLAYKIEASPLIPSSNEPTIVIGPTQNTKLAVTKPKTKFPD